MYIRTDPGAGLGQPVQVFSCTVDAMILDGFEVGDYRLRPAHYEKLMVIREFAKAMQNAGRTVSVTLEGFTDSSGKEIMNRGLSVSRAAEVQNFLLRVGVGVHDVVGSGESNPRGDNRTEAGRRKNRRVEIHICVKLPPPPPGGAYNLKISNLMQQIGFKPAVPLAGLPAGRRLGDAPLSTPWRERVGLRSKPQYLSYMKLDRFEWKKAALTARLQQMVKQLAGQVKMSWNTMQPIGFIRLVGHTDSTGKHDYNVYLGNQRAQAVKEALETLLKEDILKRRVAITVEESPGETQEVGDNRTAEGRALNRRVEVFVSPPEPAPPKLTPPPPPPPPPPPTGTTYPWGKLPTLPPGKSLKQFVDEWLRDRNVPKWLRTKIWEAITGKDSSALSSLLEAAGISGPAKNAFVETVRALTEGKAR